MMGLAGLERVCPPRSMVARVALVTCRELPNLDEDTRHLFTPLSARGIAATPAVWDDPDVDWSGFDLAVVRSCWDYVPRREEFLQWAAGVPHLANPAALLAWNTDKRYLRDLADRGVPIVPTCWLEPAQAWTPPDSGDWVVKPAVSLASLDAGRYRMDDHEERRLAIAHVRRLHAGGRTVMLQPYMCGVDDNGETSLVYLGGSFSHAMRKSAVLTGPDVGLDRRFVAQGGLQLRAHSPTPEELITAGCVLSALPAVLTDVLYARVDLVPGPDGRPILMELELTEPQLYFGNTPGAADRMAAAIEAQIFARRAALGGREGGSSWRVVLQV